ncbi:MAG: GH116 family glycosyl hydrolase [Candidatus Woesearchaeota archaeon]|nr:GH116 family glycosyl hydrolase [Candidatus Woesearchaeota archaeon]
MNHLIRKAEEIAKKCLREDYSEYGIAAGRRQFEDYWARDSFFASFGAIASGDYPIVRKNLELFLSNEDSIGQVPLRIGTKFIAFKVLGIKFYDGTKSRAPRYIIDRNYPNFMPKTPADQNSLLIIAAEEYIRKSDDKKFAVDNYEMLKKAMDWNFTLDKNRDFLIEEGYYCSWLDCVKKSGNVLYTEVCHYKACAAFSRIARRIGKKEDWKKYSEIAQKTREKINEKFWNGKFYNDWIDFNGKIHGNFSTDGNLLAIMFGISSRKKSRSIISCIKDFGLENGVPYKTNYPKYRFSEIDFLLYPAGMKDYHNGMSWLWIGCAGILAKAKAGMKKESVQLAEKIAKKIIECNGVYEVYEENGKPVKRLFYKSEFPFAWASGLFLYTIKEAGIINNK